MSYDVLHVQVAPLHGEAARRVAVADTVVEVEQSSVGPLGLVEHLLGRGCALPEQRGDGDEDVQ